MGLFGFLKPPKPVGFDYKPRFYDQKKEEFQERLKKTESRAGDDPEAMKARIRRDISRKSSYLMDKKVRQEQVMKSNIRLLVIIVVLVVLTYVTIEVYLPRIIRFFE